MRYLAKLFSAAFCATAATATEMPDRPQWNDQDALEMYRSVLYRNYRSCDGIFETQMPPTGLARKCAQVYFLLKLSFLKDVTPKSFFGMEAEDRAKANRQGYDAYRAWSRARIEGLN